MQIFKWFLNLQGSITKTGSLLRQDLLSFSNSIAWGQFKFEHLQHKNSNSDKENLGLVKWKIRNLSG